MWMSQACTDARIEHLEGRSHGICPYWLRSCKGHPQNDIFTLEYNDYISECIIEAITLCLVDFYWPL